MNIIHIGLPKTASSTLQREVFPFICKKKKLFFLGHSYLTKILNVKNKNILKTKKNKGKKFILSYEGLISPEGNPYYFREKSKKNKLFFGYNSHILITLREPESFLNSIYLQNINTLNLKKEKDYFISKKEMKKKINQKKNIDYTEYWCLEMYKQKELINLYKKKFKQVTVVKTEALKNPNLIKKVFNLNYIDAKNITKLFKKKHFNMSPGKKVVKLAFLLENFLSFFNLSLFQLYNLSKKYQNKIDNSIFKKITILRKILKGILYLINFRFIYAFFLIHLLKDEKYKCDFSKFGFYNLKKEKKFYKNFPLIKQYKN